VDYGGWRPTCEAGRKLVPSAKPDDWIWKIEDSNSKVIHTVAILLYKPNQKAKMKVRTSH